MTEGIPLDLSEEDTFPFDTTATYYIYTPFWAEATAQSLLEMLQTENDLDTSSESDIEEHFI